MSLAAPSAAQENVDPPTVPVAPDVGDGRGSLLAPSAWMVLITPLQRRVDLKLSEFYIGELNVPVEQVDLSIRATKFLTITPSYMYYSAPASALNKLAPRAGRTIYRQLRRAPIPHRRDTELLHSQVRDLRPQHVCQEVSSRSSRRYQPLSRSGGDSAPPRCRRPRLEAFRRLRSLLRAEQWWVEQGATFGWRHAATHAARVVSAVLHV